MNDSYQIKNNDSEISLHGVADILADLKDVDVVMIRSHQCELWHPERNFKEFSYSASDLNILDADFERLKEDQEEAWRFSDARYYSHSFHNYHYLDYALHGERLGWKTGDEYWLVYNIAGKRFELREKNAQKWTPLEKFRVNENLEIKFKMGYISSIGEKCYIKNMMFNSYPDRININIRDNNISSIYDRDIIYYYQLYSSFSYSKRNFDLCQYYENIINNSRFRKLISIALENHMDSRRYNLREGITILPPEEYYKIFLQHNYKLKKLQVQKRGKLS